MANVRLFHKLSFCLYVTRRPKIKLFYANCRRVVVCSTGLGKDADFTGFSVAHGMLESRTDDLLRLSNFYAGCVCNFFVFFSCNFSSQG